MKERFLDSSTCFIQNYITYSKEDLEKLRYGLEGLYLTISKTIIVIIISLILGTYKETLFSIFLFSIVRFFSFGFHAEKSYQCLIISIIEFNLFPLLITNLTINKNLLFIICIISIINFLLFAPADTVKRPLPNKKKRKIRKLCSVILGIIYSLFAFVFINTWFGTSFLVTLIMGMISVNPLIYILFKQPFNNYKNYSRL